MADKRISQLVERVTLLNNDVFPIVASGATTTNKVTLQTIDDYMQTNLDFGVTSVAMTVPTGLSVTGTPITSTGTFVVTFTAGYSIPTNAKQTQWDTAYSNRIVSVTAPITFASNVLGITQSGTASNGFLSSTDWNTFNSKQNALTFGNLTEATSSVLTITGGTGAVIGSGTSIEVKQASSTQDGFLDSADWTTFNGKQNALTGTGIVKSTGGTITYLTDNTSNWDSAYNDKINSAAVTGTTTKTLTLTQQDGGTITTTWTDLVNPGTVTSVGVSMPSAFSVANSPITSSGTIAITGAGTISQYIDGTGALQTFPSGLPPTGAAGGDLTGTYPNPTVHRIHGIDFQNGTPTADDVWVYGGSPAKWQHQKLHSNQVTEDGNLFYTDARARASISESVTGLDYNSTTGVFSTSAGYGIPTTASQTNWDAAYNDKINSAAVTGTTTKTLTLTQQDGGTITASWTDINTDAVTSVFGRTGAVVATSGDYNTDQVTEGTSNLYFTNARSRSSITLTTTGTSGAATYNSTTGVLNIPSYVGGVTSVNTLTGAVVLTTSNIAEGTNLYYTNARARSAISLTTTGTSGAATYDSATGVLNVPQYSTDLSGYVTLGTAQIITAQKIFSGSGDPRTWFRSTSNDTAGIYLEVLNAGTKVGNATLRINNVGTFQLFNGTNTDTLNFSIFTNGNATLLGALTASNFSGSSSGTNTGDQTLAGLGGQPQLNGTGFVKASGTTISYDNTSYLPLGGGTLTGILQVSPASGVAWYYANRINTSTEAGIQLRTNGTPDWYLGTRNAAGQTDNYHFYSYTTNTSVARITPAGQFIFAGQLGNGTHTYTLPSATGTLALTSDIPSLTGYVTLATAQTITGEKIFNSTNLFRKGTVTNNVSTSAYADYNQAAAVIVGGDSILEMMGIDDNTTWRHMLTFKNINPTTGNLVSGFGFGTHMNTGNIGNNTFDRFALSWGTNVYPQDNADIMSWKPSGKVGIGETDPQTALHIKRNEGGTGVLRLENTSSAGYSNIQFYNNSGVFRGSFGFINPSVGSIGSIGQKFLWDVSGADIMVRGANMIIGDEATAQGKLYVVDGSVTTKTTFSNNSGHYWYSISDANNIVRVRDTTEVSITKTGGAGYGNMVAYSEIVEKNFTMDFKLTLGNPGSGYRHFAIAIPTNNTDNVGVYDYIVFRHNVSSTADNQIRVDQSGVTTLDSVGSFNPNFADGNERHIRITLNDTIIFIEVEGAEVFRGTMPRRSLARGRIGFAIFESGSTTNAWALIRNFNLQQYGDDRTSLPLNVTRNYSSLSPASIAVGSYNYSLAYGWHVRDGVVGNLTQVRSNNGVTAMGRTYGVFPAGSGGEAVITIPNRKAFRKVYGYVRVRGGGSTDGWNNGSLSISANNFMDGIAITGVDTANANETWIWGIVCNNYNANENIAQKPSFVGNNYQTFLTNHSIVDGLWLYTNDGSGRTPVKTFYFERTLSSDITGDIRIRIMSDQDPDTNEDNGLEEFAIYVAPETASDYNNAATYNFLGDVVSTGDVIAFSDASVKDNIRPIENVLTRVCQSRGVKYDRTDKDSVDNIGFIAQELEEAFPELVVTDVEGKKSVKYQNASAILFEAVKEQQKQIEELKNLVNAIAK